MPEADDLNSPVDIDVTSVLNNWVKGVEHGGYGNYGFVFKGPVESDQSYTDNNVCIVRYSDLSLTVTYKYDKTPTVLYVPPEKPTILVNPAVLATRKNVALAANGATATALNFTSDSAYPGSHFQPSYAIDGKRYMHPVPPPNDADGFWRDEHGLPSWLEIDFGGSKTISEVDVFTALDSPDNLKQVDPSPTQTFTRFGATAFDIQFWDGVSWLTIPGASITGNNLAWRKIAFASITTSKIRVVVNGSPDGVARIVEVEAYSK